MSQGIVEVKDKGEGVVRVTMMRERQGQQRREREKRDNNNNERDERTLGARGHLSRGDIEVTLRFFKQFIHTLSRGYMVESFAMYPPL